MTSRSVENSSESNSFTTIIEDLIDSGGHQSYCDVIQFDLATACTCDWDKARGAAWDFLETINPKERTNA